jgi:hypothetical protein
MVNVDGLRMTARGPLAVRVSGGIHLVAGPDFRAPSIETETGNP